MQLKKFDQTWVKPNVRNNTPVISFHKSGVVQFSRGAVELLKLSAGSKVAFFQDKDETKDWYLLLDDERGFEISQRKSGKYVNWKFNCAELVRHIKESLGVEKGLRVPIAKEPVTHENLTLWPLITSAALDSQ